MHIRPEHLPGWIAITSPERSDSTEHLSRLLELASDPSWCARRFVAVEKALVVGVAWLAPIGSDRYLLGCPRTLGGTEIGTSTAALVDEAVQEARRRSAVSLEARIPVDRESDALVAALQRTGARRQGVRIEYKTPLDELPRESPGRLAWHPASPDELDRFAALLAACGTGADGLESDEDPRQWLDDVLDTPERVVDPAACLHRGELDGEDTAFVCAQTEPHSGWSTLPFMGLVPGARGQGLGHEVHRHGIEMLRAQGATLYHGGTGSENAAMLACFARQACREWKRFGVWQWPDRLVDPCETSRR